MISVSDCSQRNRRHEFCHFTPGRRAAQKEMIIIVRFIVKMYIRQRMRANRVRILTSSNDVAGASCHRQPIAIAYPSTWHHSAWRNPIRGGADRRQGTAATPADGPRLRKASINVERLTNGHRAGRAPRRPPKGRPKRPARNIHLPTAVLDLNTSFSP